jgi:2-polyprenyl-6-hydroxyphenyl methylase/3-demethylubiquinone-9 3-methyltransferase
MTDAKQTSVNNTIYDELGERWYGAEDDPVALLRAESRLRNPWVAHVITETFGNQRCRILDVGCGAGFLSNALSLHHHEVVGLDASEDSLTVARRHDVSGKTVYEKGNALALPYVDSSFDVVCAMDFLEHVENPARVIAEAARVLKPGGIFLFYTFNRNPLAWLIVIQGVEWLIHKTPPHLHILRLFIKPREIRQFCVRAGLSQVQLRGVRPVIFSRAFFRLLFKGIVKDDFRFKFAGSTWIAYSGVARKNGSLS